MTHKVTVTTEEAVALRPLLESAVRTEMRMLGLGLERTDERLQHFEEKALQELRCSEATP